MDPGEIQKYREYTCEYCKQTFTEGWTEEEALAEFERDWPGQDANKGARVCDS